MRNLFFISMIAVAVVISSEAATTRFNGYSFESYVVSDLGYRYGETRKHGGSLIQVEKDDSYAIVIRNPLPVRVAVAVSIDGLNVIDGKRTTPDKAKKWIIEAHSSITLRGWQTDHSSLRRFVFTDKRNSYAKWKGKRDGKAYTRNLGVIGIAWFWNSAELYAALHPPRPFTERNGSCAEELSADAAPSPRSMKKRAPAKSQAGTGMGRKETHNVVNVAFHYDTGMYRQNDALVLYYEFARKTDCPKPFIDDVSRHGFAPEMP